ncbi:MAG: hypothetical protein HC916_00985 [Coleofasciculaceae cyanobacterium SM2_1_6]|nr:hypothetical protein [Coleofasciculaceae cyanobacterium SM2_1_6]
MTLLSQTCQRLLLVGLTSCFFGALTAPGLAQWNNGNYQPPREVGTPERTRPAGTRSPYGCPISENSPPMVGIVPLNAFGGND